MADKPPPRLDEDSDAALDWIIFGVVAFVLLVISGVAFATVAKALH